MIKTFTCIVLLSFSMLLHGYEERNLLQKQATPAQLPSMLADKAEWITYPAYEDREGWNRLTAGYRERLIREGERYLDYEWKAVKATDYLEFERSGSRAVMQEPYGSNTSAISALFLAEMAEGQGRFIPQLFNGCYHLCEMTSWVLSAHLTVQHSRRTIPDHKEHIIDLTSGSNGMMLSWIHYFLNKEFDKINPVVSERIKYEIDRKILTPYLTETRYWWLATNASEEKPGLVNNWNPWCNSSVLICFLLMEDNQQKLHQGVYKTMVSVDKFLNFVKADGACEEGPSYWNHAAAKLYDYLQVLHDATQGKINLFHEPMVKKMGEYICRSYTDNDWVVNFADAKAREHLDFRQVYRYGKAVKSDEMMDFAAWLKQKERRLSIRGNDTYRTLQSFMMDSEVDSRQPRHELPPYTWYPETEFCYIVHGKGFLAAKGGHNAESHNHNDIGNFILFLDNLPVFIDAGVGTYTRQTFSSERYSIWTMQSDYHNVPRINGHSQKTGRSASAHSTCFNETDSTFTLDIARAYPDEAGVRKWVRSFKVNDDSVEVAETFQVEQPSVPNELHFLAWGDIDIRDKGTCTVSVEGRNATLEYDPAMFECRKEEFEVTDKRLSRIWGDRIFRITLVARKVEPSGEYRYTIRY